MALIVESGAGLPNAESYVSVADCGTYAVNHGLVFDTSNAPLCESSLRRATEYIDNTYRYRFPGYRTFRRAQAREWPRYLAYYFTPDFGGNSPYFIDPRAVYPFDLIANNVIPIEIFNATCEAAIKEFGSPGVLLPDLERGNAIAMVKAGSVEVKYGAGASPTTIFQTIESMLTALIGPRQQYSGRLARI